MVQFGKMEGKQLELQQNLGVLPQRSWSCTVVPQKSETSRSTFIYRLLIGDIPPTNYSL